MSLIAARQEKINHLHFCTICWVSYPFTVVGVPQQYFYTQACDQEMFSAMIASL
jgi:hypothetical protein